MKAALPVPKPPKSRMLCEQIGIRVEPELKARWDALGDQGYDKREWLREVISYALDDVEKKLEAG